MLQIIQYQKSGEMFVEELPSPKLKKGSIIVQNVSSLISAGTERTSVETAQASMIGKAKSRPDLVKQVLDNAKREGLLTTYEKVKNRLDNYKELGYSSAGIVVESSVDEFKLGDRVACAGTAFHAEFVSISKNLAAKIPDNVSFDEASFTTLGSIALQGVRQADVKIGDSVAVIGLGLIGIITIQILKANGCKVIGLDISSSNFNLAKNVGCNKCVSIDPDSVRKVEDFTENKGCDSVIITASTSSNDPLEKAVEFSRKKGKVIIVGNVGMNFPRSPAYEKEIEIKLSCSYGPGRYDQEYEEWGIDYPFAYVRWTENRNMYTILNLLSEEKLSFKSLITHRFSIQDALKAYDIITGKTKENYIGIVINYPKLNNGDSNLNNRKIFNLNLSKDSNGIGKNDIIIGFIGAGNFAQSYLLPPLKKLNVKLKGVATSRPVNAKSVSDKFGFDFFTSDPKEILDDDIVNTVFIATRHDSHGKFVIEALKRNKNVYVEKPLCINESELNQIISLYNDTWNKRLMVGYNRRFSDPIKDIKEFFKDIQEPLNINYRINAGFIPKSSWIQSSEQNGRIIGEVCHFIDTIQYITNSKPISVFAKEVIDKTNRYSNDNVNIVVSFSNGSVGNISYISNGSKLMEKELLEVFGGGKSVNMVDFKKVIYHDVNKKKVKKFSGEKGHLKEVNNTVQFFKNGIEPIPLTDLLLTTLTTFKIMESIKQGKELKIEI